MLPHLAIVDPSLTDGTPASVTFSSGFDAVTQVIEPYLSIRSNPLTDALCQTAIPMGLTALAQLAREEDEIARDHIAYVSLIGGLALANAGLGAVHWRHRRSLCRSAWPYLCPPAGPCPVPQSRG
jgi:hypothetical protein